MLFSSRTTQLILLSLIACSLSCGNRPPSLPKDEKVHPEPPLTGIQKEIQLRINQMLAVEKKVMERIKTAEARSTGELTEKEQFDLAQQGFADQFKFLDAVMADIATQLLHCPTIDEASWLRALSFFKKKRENLLKIGQNTGFFLPTAQSRRHSA
jgi:hypothetical protein